MMGQGGVTAGSKHREPWKTAALAREEEEEEETKEQVKEYKEIRTTVRLEE